MSSHLPLPAVVFDPEGPQRRNLCQLLALHPAIEVKGEASSLDEAIEGMASARLLFCALGGNPAATLKWLGERPPTIDVILTASEERWAAMAFEVDALDFLLKPVNRERLNRTVRRLLRLDWSLGLNTGAGAGPARVFVPFERGRRMIAIDEICAINAIGNYTQILLAGGATEVAMRPLRRWEETLPGGSFLRIHRSTLANAKRLRRIEASGDGEGFFAEVDGLLQPLPVSRRCLTAARVILCNR